MDGDSLTQIGVGGILCLLILREVFAFVRPLIGRWRMNRHGTENNGVANGRMAHETISQIADLHRMMTLTDSDGTPLVFVPRSLSTAIHELAQATSQQVKLLERLDSNITEARREIRRQADV